MSCERPNFSRWDDWSKTARKSKDGAPDPAGTRILRNMNCVRDHEVPKSVVVAVASTPTRKGKK
jgi:hypothetical protein